MTWFGNNESFWVYTYKCEAGNCLKALHLSTMTYFVSPYILLNILNKLNENACWNVIHEYQVIQNNVKINLNDGFKSMH